MQQDNESDQAPGMRAPLIVMSLFFPASWAVFYALGGTLRSFVLTAVLVAMATVAVVAWTYKPNPNIFMGSGTTPPATFAQELILRRKGGTGSSYFGDPTVGFGELSNFSYREGRQIDFRQLLAEKWDVIGPFCVDDERRQMVLVEVEPGFDPSEVGPFYFQSQRDNAIKLYTVPYDEYVSVIESLPNTHTNNVLLVYNTARCGSTLLSQCLDKVNGMQSISEPDCLTGLTHIASEAKNTRDNEIKTLARASVKLLCHLRRRVHPERDGVCIKLRFQMVYIADLMEQAVPDARAIFLYRNGLDVIDSMGAAFINTGAYRAIRAIGLDSLYVYHLSTLPQHLWKLMPLMRDTERFPLECYKWLGAVSPFVFTWLSVMTYAQEAYRCGLIKCMIRYEDMTVGKTQYVAEMLRQVGFEVHEEEAAGAQSIFSRDAHGATSTRSRRTLVNKKTGEIDRKGYSYLQKHEVAHVEDVISRHGVIDHADYIIPGTLTM